MTLSVAANARMMFLAGACVASTAIGQEAGNRSIGDEMNLFRWREDYSFLRDRPEKTWLERLKFIPLNKANTTYLTLGGQVRERVEIYDDAFFDLTPAGRSFTSFATRLLAHADLHVGTHFRAFAELGSFWETGREPASRPFDVGDLELQQGFFDLTGVDGPARRWTVRLGRQEFPLGSGRLVGIREAANVRLTFDAVKFEGINRGRTVVAFFGRPVEPKRGVFESSPSGRETFWALDWTGLGTGTVPNVETFYLGRRLRGAVFSEGSATETRHTLGGRIWGRPAQPWDYSVQASYQFGSFGDSDIRAWGVATDTGYTAAGLPARPRFALRADIASGDGQPRDGVLGTFEAPYPALNYFSEASITAPANAWDLHPYVEFRPARTVVADLGVDFLWRLCRGDAVYRSGGGILVPPGTSDASFVTATMQLNVTWRPIPFVALQGALVRAPAGRLIKDAGGRSTTFGLLSADLRL